MRTDVAGGRFAQPLRPVFSGGGRRYWRRDRHASTTRQAFPARFARSQVPSRLPRSAAGIPPPAVSAARPREDEVPRWGRPGPPHVQVGRTTPASIRCWPPSPIYWSTRPERPCPRSADTRLSCSVAQPRTRRPATDRAGIPPTGPPPARDAVWIQRGRVRFRWSDQVSPCSALRRCASCS